jgi:hypothetical protein
MDSNMNTSIKLNDLKDSLKIKFKNRQEALTWLRVNDAVMKYIVIDVVGGCMLRNDDAFTNAKVGRDRSKQTQF